MAILESADSYFQNLVGCVVSEAGDYQTCLDDITGYSEVSADCQTCSLDYYRGGDGTSCFFYALLDPEGEDAQTCETEALSGWSAACDSTYVPEDGSGSYSTSVFVAISFMIASML
jgi:hypothetical protein